MQTTPPISSWEIIASSEEENVLNFQLRDTILRRFRGLQIKSLESGENFELIAGLFHLPQTEFLPYLSEDPLIRDREMTAAFLAFITAQVEGWGSKMRTTQKGVRHRMENGLLYENVYRGLQEYRELFMIQDRSLFFQRMRKDSLARIYLAAAVRFLRMHQEDFRIFLLDRWEEESDRRSLTDSESSPTP